MRTRQNKLRKTLNIALIIIGILCLAAMIARFIYINLKFPSPRTMTYEQNETITLGNYEIALSSYSWGNETLLQEWAPNYNDFYETSSPDDIRVGFVTLSVTKLADDQTILDLTSLHFESGAWGNQFDMDLFYDLNPEEDSLYLELQPNETRNVILPMNMNKDHFRASTWNKIDDRDFYLVLQYYPVKHQIRLQ